MHTVGQLEAALALAKRLGFQIRLECLDGRGGGGCEIRGQQWIFVDLSLSPQEQLDQVQQALRGHRICTDRADSSADASQSPEAA